MTGSDALVDAIADAVVGALTRRMAVWESSYTRAMEAIDMLEANKGIRPDCYVYAILAGRPINAVKIGVSVDPRRRLNDLQIASPVELRLLCQFDGTTGIEKSLHGIFASYHSHGEWFRYEGAVAEFVRLMADPDFFE